MREKLLKIRYLILKISLKIETIKKKVIKKIKKQLWGLLKNQIMFKNKFNQDQDL